MDIKTIIAELSDERDRLNRAIAVLQRKPRFERLTRAGKSDLGQAISQIVRGLASGFSVGLFLSWCT